jgi:hypothetical protein
MSDVLGEIPKHLSPVLVDLFSGRCWAIFGPHTVPCLERLIALRLFHPVGQIVFEDRLI